MAKKPVFIALLRGINVGGKNKLPMKDLVAIFDGAGCSDVRTYIQSGNVVFRASVTLARQVPRLVADGILAAHGLDVPIVLRSATELARTASDNPYIKAKEDPTKLHVAFLAERPPAKRLAGLDSARSPPDAFSVKGSEIYLLCPNGMARTKLTNQYFDSRLGTTSTVRNWRTVLKLVELSAE